jgi:primosomal protein N'
VRYSMSYSPAVLIQTYLREWPLIQHLLEWNTKTYIADTLKTRKKYGYAPYGSIYTIWVRGDTQDGVHTIVTRLANKLSIEKENLIQGGVYTTTSIYMSYDHDIWTRRNGKWMQKILLKWENLEPIVSTIQVELLKNRNIHIDRS